MPLFIYYIFGLATTLTTIYGFVVMFVFENLNCMYNVHDGVDKGHEELITAVMNTVFNVNRTGRAVGRRILVLLVSFESHL